MVTVMTASFAASVSCDQKVCRAMTSCAYPRPARRTFLTPENAGIPVQGLPAGPSWPGPLMDHDLCSEAVSSEDHRTFWVPVVHSTRNVA